MGILGIVIVIYRSLSPFQTRYPSGAGTYDIISRRELTAGECLDNHHSRSVSNEGLTFH